MNSLCRKLQERLAGEGPGAIRADLAARRHFEECEECFSVLEARSRLDEALAEMPADDVPEGAIGELLARVKHEGSANSARSETDPGRTTPARLTSRSLGWILPAAAVVVLAVAVLTPTGYLDFPRRLSVEARLQDANRAYEEEDFRKAISLYERVIELDPANAAAHFYLGSAHQALFRPTRADDPKDAGLLEIAIDSYRRALELSSGPSVQSKKVRMNSLAALAAMHSEGPQADYTLAIRYAEELIAENPDDAQNLFAMANLYEKFDEIEAAERTYVRAAEINPGDIQACGALAAFYNKPLWDGQSRFGQAIGALKRCATLSPDDPAGFYKVATFYWDKAFRDPMLDDSQKDAYADKGLAAVERALELEPGHIDALVYKGLLYRVKAQVAQDPAARFSLLDQAEIYQSRALELREAQAQTTADDKAAPPASESGQEGLKNEK